MSWLIMWFAFGVVVGLVMAVWLEAPWSFWQTIIVVASLSFLVFRNKTVAVVGLVIVAGILLGLWRGSVMQAALLGYEPYYGKQVTVRGTVSEDVVLASDGKRRLQLQKVSIAGKDLPGKVWISTAVRADIKRGDNVQFEGLLREGFGNLPASMARAKLVKMERPVHGDVGREVRDWFAGVIRKVIPEPEASLGIGYLVGQRSTLPEDLDKQLQLLGLTHVVVASGYNLTILVRFTRRLFARISKYMAFMAALMMIAGFVLMTGFSPSMSRAAMVTGLSLVAWYFGRTIQPLVLLMLVAAVTGFINPSFVWGDIGWYLSMLSFAGIMILAPLIKHYFFGKDTELRTLPSIVLETMSAQVATLPLIAFIFGQYSPFALPANLLVLPLIPFAMLSTFVAGIASLFSVTLGEIVHWPATIVLSYMTFIVDKIAQVPGAAAEISFSLPMFVGGYIALALACIILWRKTKHNFGKDNIVL